VIVARDLAGPGSRRAPAVDVPVALADLMENALAKDPAKRPRAPGLSPKRGARSKLSRAGLRPLTSCGARLRAARRPPAEDEA